MRTIAVVNQKGGSGKTTMAINLAAALAKRGHRTLIVDMDPQAHCAAGLAVPEDQVEYSIAEALLANAEQPVDSRLLWEVSRDLVLAPSTMQLAALEAPEGGLHRLADKDQRLAGVLDRLNDQFDWCLIDCPPTIGILTYNALCAARETLVPVETGYFAYRGAQKQWKTIQHLIRRLDRPIVCHVLPTLYQPDSELAQRILRALKRDFAGQILPMAIEVCESFREAARDGRPVIEAAPDSKAARQVEELATWLEEHGRRERFEHGEPAIGAEHANAGLANAGEGGHQISTFTRAPAPAPEIRIDPSVRGGRAAEVAARVRAMAHRAQVQATGPARTTTAPPSPSGPPDIAARPDNIGWSPRAMPDDPRAPRWLAAIIRPMRPALPPGRSAPARRSPLHAVEPPRPDTPAGVQRVFGARQLQRGVLFVQPGTVGQRVYIAGEFNQWSPTATPLRYDDQLGVHQAVIDIPPGEYKYRLVVDGQWKADPHGDTVIQNQYGERNSILIVEETQVAL